MNKQHRVVRYRLHPRTRAKGNHLMGLAGASRFVWNNAVGTLKDAYGADGKCEFSAYTLYRKFTKLRNHKDTVWLKEYSAHIVRGALKPIETTYKQFFKTHGASGLPKFKNKYRATPSFMLPTGAFKVMGESLYIQRLGWVALTGKNPYPNSKPVSGQVKYECGKWYAYLIYEVVAVDLPKRIPHEIECVGIDRNVGQVALSDGRIIRQPNLERLEARKRRYQRRMAKQVKGSNRRGVTKLKLARTFQKIRQDRSNWAHQTTRSIANEYDVAYIEDLNTKGMMKSAKGTVESPGRNVSQKRGLNKSIQGSNWHQLERMLGYKMLTVKVPSAYTSQTCHQCGDRAKSNRKSQAKFVCGACEYTGNADINAALNILASGNGATGRGDGDAVMSVGEASKDMLAT